MIRRRIQQQWWFSEFSVSTTLGKNVFSCTNQFNKPVIAQPYSAFPPSQSHRRDTGNVFWCQCSPTWAMTWDASVVPQVFISSTRALWWRNTLTLCLCQWVQLTDSEARSRVSMHQTWEQPELRHSVRNLFSCCPRPWCCPSSWQDSDTTERRQEPCLIPNCNRITYSKGMSSN